VPQSSSRPPCLDAESPTADAAAAASAALDAGECPASVLYLLNILVSVVVEELSFIDQLSGSQVLKGDAIAWG
jgi:hypothetical protein